MGASYLTIELHDKGVADDVHVEENQTTTSADLMPPRTSSLLRWASSKQISPWHRIVSQPENARRLHRSAGRLLGSIDKRTDVPRNPLLTHAESASSRYRHRSLGQINTRSGCSTRTFFRLPASFIPTPDWRIVSTYRRLVSRWRRLARSKGYFVTIVTLSIFAQTGIILYLVGTYVVEVQACDGPSMIPTLATDGDILLVGRMAGLRAFHRLTGWIWGNTALNAVGLAEEGSEGSQRSPLPRNGQGFTLSSGSKFDRMFGYPISLGDVVVASKKIDPTVFVCKRVLGLPGDKVLLDPRMLGVIVDNGSEGISLHDLFNLLLQDQNRDEAAAAAGKKSPSPPSQRKRSLTSDSVSASPPASADTSPSINLDDEIRAISPQILSSLERTPQGDFVVVPPGCVFLAGDNLSNSTDSRHYGFVPIGCLEGKVLARILPRYKPFTVFQTFPFTLLNRPDAGPLDSRGVTMLPMAPAAHPRPPEETTTTTTTTTSAPVPSSQ